MPSFWKRHQPAIVLGTLGVAHACINNTWIFTNTPLAGEEGSNAVAKVFYMIGLLASEGILFGAIGHYLNKAIPTETISQNRNYNSMS